ncbi:hypothetical protein FRC14_000234 [Serendipita sp. 396]|nr:hypothetical protein FRC14_000234 [Serendipita sp. 396]KAG8786866.1 hypothetical protein FRC15_010518 [Serendipita sp. 397]
MSRSRRFPGESAAEHGIKEFISDKERQLKIYQQDIEKNEYKLRNSEKAIENLERALPLARRAAEIQKQNLEIFSAMRARISGLKITFDTPLKEERTSRRLCENLQSTLAKHTNVYARLTNALANFAQNRVNEIAHATRQLEEDLHSWRFSKNIHQESLVHSRNALKEAQSDLSIAKRTFSRVPAEVWVDIFRWRAQGDLDEFYATHTARPFQPTVMVLFRVCRLWRDIMRREPDLWCYIAVHPCPSWSNNKIELLNFSLGMARGRKLLVSNLSQSLLWNSRPSFLQSSLDPSSPVDSSVISGSYEVTLVTSANDYSIRSRINGLPFRNPHKLTLVHRPTGPLNRYLFSSLASFISVDSLEVVGPTLYSLDSLQIKNRFPNLTQLSLESDTLSYSFGPLLLPSTLQVLRIRHSGESQLPSVQGSICLPRLGVLGVTPPAASLFQAVDACRVQQLVLYGPRRTATVAPTSPAGNSKIRLQPVRYLEFRSWLPPGWISGVRSCDVVVTFLDWVKQMPQVRKLKFVDSHVDGRRLLNLLRSWRVLEDSTGPQQWEITLDCCTGITRYECDELKGLVKKINVFV